MPISFFSKEVIISQLNINTLRKRSVELVDVKKLKAASDKDMFFFRFLLFLQIAEYRSAQGSDSCSAFHTHALCDLVQHMFKYLLHADDS